MLKKMYKSLITLGAASALTSMLGITAYASGWVHDAGGWWYGTNANNTTWHSNGWQWVDGNNDGVAECYYFDKNGYIAVSTTTLDGCTVNADGAWTVNNVVQTRSVSAEAGKAAKKAVSVKYDHIYNEMGESATIYGLDSQGNTVWTYQTVYYETAQYDAIFEIGIYGDAYFITEAGNIIKFNLADGTIIWKNSDFRGASVGYDFGKDGTLYLCGAENLDFFAVDKNGKTLKRIEEFSNDYYWPYEVKCTDAGVVITMEMGPDYTKTPAGRFLVKYGSYTYSLLD